MSADPILRRFIVRAFLFLFVVSGLIRNESSIFVRELCFPDKF